MSLIFQRFARSKATATLPRTLGRRFLATAPTLARTSPPSTKPLLPGSKRLAQLGAAGLSLGAALQYQFGTAENFVDEKFVTTKKSEDLADFYGTEDFMELFCVFPFMVKFVMRGAEFDDEGTIHTWGLLGPGELEVTIDFDEREVDTTGDGEPDTLVWFNKKEHFHDTAPSFLGGFTLWEMTQNFGFHRYEDGTSVVYHHGESFRGFFLVRFIFQLHAKYVIWATAKYINSDTFGSEDCDEELEEQRQNIPLHVFKSFVGGLTRDIERAKSEAKHDTKKQQELEVTLRRLNTISQNMDKMEPAALPRLRTLRSHKTKVAHVHLVVDDKETKDAIHAAVNQIGASSGRRHEPASELQGLARRTTLSLRQQHEAPGDKHDN